MVLLIALSFFIFAAYLCYACFNCGIPSSLSETYYLLNQRGKPGWIFSLVMILIAGLLMPAFIEVSDTSGFWYTFLSFFTCAAIIFVGFSPKFRDGQGTIHVASAMTAAASGILWSLFTIWYVPLIVAAAFTLPLVVMWKTAKTFWLEMIAFFSVYISILCSL